MSRALNALVLGVGGNVSQSIQKALAIADTPTRVVAACISPHAPGLYLAERSYVSPLARSPDFIPWLLDVAEREQIDVVMSGSEIVLEAIAPHTATIQEQTGAVCIVSPPEVLRTGRDKLETCRWLEVEGLPVPGYADCDDPEAVRSLVERCGFPLIAKPRFGKGSDGVLTVRDEHDLGRFVGAEDISLRDVVGGQVVASDLVLQEYLGNEEQEYTAGCFCDRDGRPCGTIVMRRTLQSGTTVSAELGRFPEVREAATAIVSALQPFGPCNVQLRMHQGRAVPFEINPRFSGTTALRARMGFNEVDAALRHFVLGEDAPQLDDVGSGIALRYWNEVYIPADAVTAMGRDGHLGDPRSHDVEVEGWGIPAVRVLVTGSSGYVGSAVARHLLAGGHEVIGLGRRLTKNNRLLSSAVALDLSHSGTARLLIQQQPRCDAIVHAAAALDYAPFEPAISLTNCLGTQQIIELATAWEVESLVYLSSLPVIGRPLELPITESHPIDPPTAYHASKVYGEHLLAVARRGGMDAVSLRLSAPVGPGMPDGRILSVFVQRALSHEPLELAGNGTRGQDFVDIRDISAAVEASIERHASGVLNVASGSCITNMELAQLCVEVLDSRSEVRLSGAADPEDDVRWEVSIAAAQRMIGYRPSHALEQSIADMASASLEASAVD